ncbi:MAG TPA: questin oxidase family protein [Epulopiscium sp.]|nr:questin oxidase family protein [Candidatus Epulonipiscium sp.]
MKITETINCYARPYSPYMNGLVNHLPMGQLALYMMGNDVEKIKSYSEAYIKIGRIDKIKKDYLRVTSIEECLGKRDQYEGCLELIMEKMASKGVGQLVKEILNDYPLGMASGLFHTTIRLAYSVEGMNLDKEFKEEVARSLAYYVTAYRAGKQFQRKVSASYFVQEVEELLDSSHIIKLLASETTRGKRIKALYADEIYMAKGPLISGSVEEKVTGLLELLLPLLDETNNIVILHCITALHALLVLEKNFGDFTMAVDMMTTFIITHLLTVEDIFIDTVKKESKEVSWQAIMKEASNSSDVHTIKFVYSSSQLYKRYRLPALKQSARKRLSITKDIQKTE